jgi:hypothetical protein
VFVQDRRAAVFDFGEQLIDAFGAVEAADGFFREAGLVLDRLDALALGFERLDQFVPLPGADREHRFLRAAGSGLDRGLLQVRDFGSVRDAGLRRFPGGRFLQAGTVPGRCLAHVLAQVVVDVPPVRDLVRLRCALPSSLGVGAGAVAADDLDFRVFLQPVRDGAGLAVAEQVNGPAGFHVDEGSRRSPGRGGTRSRRFPRSSQCRFRGRAGT